MHRLRAAGDRTAAGAVLERAPRNACESRGRTPEPRDSRPGRRDQTRKRSALLRKAIALVALEAPPRAFRRAAGRRAGVPGRTASRPPSERAGEREGEGGGGRGEQGSAEGVRGGGGGGGRRGRGKAPRAGSRSRPPGGARASERGGGGRAREREGRGRETGGARPVPEPGTPRSTRDGVVFACAPLKLVGTPPRICPPVRSSTAVRCAAFRDLPDAAAASLLPPRRRS